MSTHMCDYCHRISSDCFALFDKFDSNAMVRHVCCGGCAINLAQQDKRTYVTEKGPTRYEPVMKSPCPLDNTMQLAYGTAILRELKRIDKVHGDDIWKGEFAGVKCLLNCIEVSE